MDELMEKIVITLDEVSEYLQSRWIACYMNYDWCYHHAVNAFDYSPRLCIKSAAPQCGKTQLLQLLELTTYSPVNISSITASGIFRMAEKIRETGESAALHEQSRGCRGGCKAGARHTGKGAGTELHQHREFRQQRALRMRRMHTPVSEIRDTRRRSVDRRQCRRPRNPGQVSTDTCHVPGILEHGTPAGTSENGTEYQRHARNDRPESRTSAFGYRTAR